MTKFERGKSGNPAARFEKGKSGNPGGRPKGTSIAALLARHMDEVPEKDRKGKTRRELMVEVVAKCALKGMPWAIQMIWERLEGKVVQPITADAESAPVRFTLDLGGGKGE